MNDKKLTMEELNYVQKEVVHNGKSISKAYILTILLGPLGIHKSYLGKVKSGIARAILTLATGGALMTIVSAMNNAHLSTKTIREMLAYNAVLAVAFLGLSAAGAIWSFADLILIPKWIKDIDANNEAIATEKAIQARYVSEHLLQNQLSAELIEQVKKEVIDKILIDLDTGKPRLTNKRKFKAPRLPENVVTSKSIELVTKDDLDYKEDDKEYPDHESQIDMKILKPDEIEGEFEEDIQSISQPLNELLESKVD